MPQYVGDIFFITVIIMCVATVACYVVVGLMLKFKAGTVGWSWLMGTCTANKEFSLTVARQSGAPPPRPFYGTRAKSTLRGSCHVVLAAFRTPFPS